MRREIEVGRRASTGAAHPVGSLPPRPSAPISPRRHTSGFSRLTPSPDQLAPPLWPVRPSSTAPPALCTNSSLRGKMNAPQPLDRFGYRAFGLGTRIGGWRVSEWLAASLEMKCPVWGCGFESRALRFFDFQRPRSALINPGKTGFFVFMRDRMRLAAGRNLRCVRRVLCCCGGGTARWKSLIRPLRARMNPGRGGRAAPANASASIHIPRGLEARVHLHLKTRGAIECCAAESVWSWRVRLVGWAAT